MKKAIWVILLAAVAILGVGVIIAFATGEIDHAVVPTVNTAFLGEVDLAEQMEIWRNQYRRMTPGNAPLVQDVGTWPAAWEEFSSRWTSAPAERNLATWLVPVTAERSGALTVLRDADGNALWSGVTDFSKEESANVTLTGALVDEEEWPLYKAAREEIDRRLGTMRGTETGRPPRLRDGEGGSGGNGTNDGPKMFVSATGVVTNNRLELHVGLQWTNDVIMDVFAYGPLHTSATHVVTYTNDENEVITWTNTTWHSVEPGLTGLDNHWKCVGTVALTNGEEAVFVDDTFPTNRGIVRFYAAFEAGDADGDGLNDVFETVALGSSTNSVDSDHDGIPDGIEYAAGSNPSTSNVWWEVKTTNAWFRQFPLPDCGLNAPSNHVFDFPVDGDSPMTGSVVSNVTVSGFVDDAIKVDGNDVDFAPNVQSFTDRSITNDIADLQSKHFTLALWDWPNPEHAGANEARIGNSTNDPFLVEWTWLAPLAVRFEPIWTTGSPP